MTRSSPFPPAPKHEVVFEASESADIVSPAMRRINVLVSRIAPTDRPVLVLGPTGCGKEVVAQQIHRRGLRPMSPFVDVNCSSIPESLMEAELFGHERGAFTGAVTNHLGHFTMVRDGTLFLDEIGDLPLSMQPKLLRVLETRHFRSVGCSTPQRFEGRIIAATHRDLARMVRDGTFREDLFYRLNVFAVEIPGLDQRREDIPALARHFARCQSRPLRFGDDALQLLAQASWPGNVRQLRNLVDRVAVLCDGDCIDAHEVAPFLPVSHETFDGSLDDVAERLLRIEGEDKMSAVEHLLVDKVLRDCDGNKTAAARVLGVNRRVIERRVRTCAKHLTEARRQIRHARSWMQSSKCSQSVEALDSALVAIGSLPPTIEARKLRFEILSQLGVCKRSQEGWLSGEALRVYAEALRVGRGLVEPKELSALMFGNWTAYLMRLELGQARQLAQEMRLRGIEAGDAHLQSDGCLALANTRFWLGEFIGALELIDELRALPCSGLAPLQRQGMEPIVLATMLEALAAHQTGDMLRTTRAYDELRRLCAKTEHAYSLAIGLQGCAWIQCCLGNRDETGMWAEQLLVITKQHSFVFYQGLAQVLLGYAVSATRPDEAEYLMKSGFTDGMAAHGGLLFHSFYSLLLSRHYLEGGRPDKAEAHALLAIQISTERQELAYLSELLCVRGRALAALGRLDTAEEELRAALAAAQRLGCVPAQTQAMEALAPFWHGAENGPVSLEPHGRLQQKWPASSLVQAINEESQ
jgi:transcriptional regulator with AAA-type ATPase domain